MVNIVLIILMYAVLYWVAISLAIDNNPWKR